MIKLSLSLKTSIILAFISVVFVIVLGYSFLSVNFFFRGMDSIVSANMEKALHSYVDNISTEQQLQLNEFSGYQISQQWQQQPKIIQQVFEQPLAGSSRLQVHQDKHWFEPPEQIYFLISLQLGEQSFFISRIGNKDEASPLVGRNVSESRATLLLFSLTLTLILALIIWLLFRKMSQPVSQLTQWTDQLSAENLPSPAPDFIYPELNQMAGLIRNSLLSVHDSLEREQNFLSFTSHELRTPISVIRNNIELSKKLSETQTEQADKQQEIIERIDRASLTMQHLCETLLWMSRNEIEDLPCTEVRLDELIHSICDELKYLLDNKQVELDFLLDDYTIELPLVPCKIVIGNLIRNAFQHTWQGKIYIVQYGSQVAIHNHCEQFNADDKNSAQGFGLGLRLTEDLCQKLHWGYHNQPVADGHHVRLQLQTAHQPDKDAE